MHIFCVMENIVIVIEKSNSSAAAGGFLRKRETESFERAMNLVCLNSLLLSIWYKQALRCNWCESTILIYT